MTDTTISNLPAGAPAEPTDQIPIARGGANYSLTAQDIANLGGGGGGSPGVPAYGSATNAMQINNGSNAFGATNLYSSYIVGGPNNSQDFYNSLNWFNGTPQEFPWFSGSSSTIVELVDPYNGNSNSLTVGYLYGSTTDANAGLSIQSGTYNDGNNWVFDVASSYPSQLFLSSTGGTVPALTFWTSSAAGVAGDTVPFVQSLAVYKDGGVVLGAATDGSQGVGTINATAYYVDGAPLTIAGYAPGGSNGAIQFNNSGAFGGISTITTNGTDNLNFSASGRLNFTETSLAINIDNGFSNNPPVGMQLFSGSGSIPIQFYNEAIWFKNLDSGHNTLTFNGLAADSVQTLNNTLDDGAGNMTATSVVVNSATGGSQGAGTVNSTGYYVNGASIYSYGQFLSENTQTVVSVGDAQSITFTGSSGTADITLVDSSKITFANPGVYLVAASVVTNDTVGGNALVYWVNQNNTPITDSATVCGQPIGGLLLTSACTYIVTTTTSDEFIEMVMTGQATTNEITATPAGTVGAASPLSPSIIVTVNRVG